jgi:hypothetical protein
LELFLTVEIGCWLRRPYEGKGNSVMAVPISLSKASRLQQALRSKLKSLSLKSQATLPIFIADPSGEIRRQADALTADIQRVDRLLTILADVRAAVGAANAESGISALLAEKAGIEERIALFSALAPDSGTTISRLFGVGLVFRDAETLAQQVAAMRLRYEAGEGREDTLSTALLDETARADLGHRVAAARRRLEEIGDRLRELNSMTRISLEPEVFAWLRQEQVV